MTPTHEEKFFQHKNMQSCLAINCRFCKYERELDGVPVEEVAPPSNLEKIRSDMRARAAARRANGTEQERNGTACTSWDPDDARWDVNALASPLVWGRGSRRDSIHDCEEEEGMEGVEDYFTEQLGITGGGMNGNEGSGDGEMGEDGDDDGVEPSSPASSSVYSNDNPLEYSLNSPLYTRSESGISDSNDNNIKNTSFDFLDDVLFDLDAWLDAGGLDGSGLHDGKNEEEYAEYVAWYKVIIRGAARGMVEREGGRRRRRRSA